MNTNEFLEPFARMLDDVCPREVVRAVDAAGDAAPIMTAAIWDALVESGFLNALVGEDVGGFGLSLADVEPLLKALGRYCVPLPVGETMVARRLLADAGKLAPDGPIALAASHGRSEMDLPFGMVASHVLLDDGETLRLLPVASLSPRPTGVRASLDTRVDLRDSSAGETVPRPAGGLEGLAALVSAAAIAGAGEELLEMIIAYANERVQFGKPIGRQKALQQQLAVMTEVMVATRLAVQLACAGGIPLGSLVAATAKSTASDSAPLIANTAHAVFGAIGVSEEHDLQMFTRRLHGWRLAHGSESYWGRLLGMARLNDVANSVEWVREKLFV